MRLSKWNKGFSRSHTEDPNSLQSGTTSTVTCPICRSVRWFRLVVNWSLSLCLIYTFLYSGDFRLDELIEYLKYLMNTIFSNILWTYGFSCTHDVLQVGCQRGVSHTKGIMGTSKSVVLCMTVHNIKVLFRIKNLSTRHQGKRTTSYSVSRHHSLKHHKTQLRF